MKTLIRICTTVFLLALFACSKKVLDKEGIPIQAGDTATGTTTNCSTSLSDILHITIFPADNAWNEDISMLQADPSSSQILAPYGTAGLKADFGSGLWDNAPIGIPFVVVCGTQQKLPIVFRANGNAGNYGDESDPGPYPVPLNAPIEGNGQGDSHVLVVDKDHGMLYELYNAGVSGDHWEASSGAVFNLSSDQQRPDGWTSADAAGLPIFPGSCKI